MCYTSALKEFLFRFEAMMRISAFLFATVFLLSCRPETYVPKPRGYYYIDFPEHTYRQFEVPTFPYKFQYPTYGNIIKDTTFFGEKPDNPYWMNIDFPSLGGMIYMTYKPITSSQPLMKLIQDAYEMTQYHTKKADYIAPLKIDRPDKQVYGELYNVTGNAASAYQFYVTDSAKHFIHGSLYFDVMPNADSLKPVNDFLRKDMEYMLQTLEWQH
jgi:gliding motility-associated lipoprotein GldD